MSKDGQDELGYAISYIEIARDSEVKSKYEANLRCRNMFDTLYLKKAKRHVVYDVYTKAGWYATPLRDPALFGTATMYTGSRESKLVVYPRNSKITGQPVIHEEFRLNRLSNQSLAMKTTPVIAA